MDFIHKVIEWTPVALAFLGCALGWLFWMKPLESIGVSRWRRPGPDSCVRQFFVRSLRLGILEEIAESGSSLANLHNDLRRALPRDDRCSGLALCQGSDTRHACVELARTVRLLLSNVPFGLAGDV